MKYVAYIMGLFGYSTMITQVSLSLGLTSNSYVFPELVEMEGDFNFLEGLAMIINFGWNNISTFLQLVTLQADIPVILSLFFISMFALGALVIVLLFIRGI